MNERNNENRSINGRLGHLSMEELERILINADEEDDAYINQISDEIIRREEIDPTGRIKGTDAAWMEFKEGYAEAPDEYIAALTEGMDANDRQRPMHKTRRLTRFAWRRTLGASAIVFIVFVSANIMTVSAFGMNVFQAIGVWTSESFQFGDNEGAGGQGNGIAPDAESSIDRFNAGHSFLPAWIPERFAYEGCVETQTDFVLRLAFNYSDGDGNLLMITARKHMDGQIPTTQYEKDEAAVEVYVVDGTTHYIFENLDFISAAWVIDNCEYSISGVITRDEMKDIITSIY